MTPSRITRASKTAIEYDSLYDIKAATVRTEHKIYGWVGGRFYEVFPGGRAIEYADLRRKQNESYRKTYR